MQITEYHATALHAIGHVDRLSSHDQLIMGALGLSELWEWWDANTWEDEIKEAGDVIFYCALLYEACNTTLPHVSLAITTSFEDVTMQVFTIQEHVKKVCYHGKPLDPLVITPALAIIVGYIVTTMHPMTTYHEILAANVEKLWARHGAKGFQREGEGV